jgi:hypothetical protein
MSEKSKVVNCGRYRRRATLAALETMLLLAQGRLWVRVSDQSRVYDLRPRKRDQGEGGRVP